MVLAGGAGSRFASGEPAAETGHKLDALLGATATEPRQSVAERALRHAVDARIGPVVVVTGGWTSAAGAPGIDGPDRPGSVHVVVNDRWADGQITSVRAGIEAADQLGADRVVIGLADQPFVTPDAWRTVAEGPGPICVATYGGRRGNPVALDRSVWTLLPEAGDEGARALMRI
ncbi:MAG: NTP transferase domain-containing protein, partial [Ilumatobacteraceae bacterium]